MNQWIANVLKAVNSEDNNNTITEKAAWWTNIYNWLYMTE